MECWNSEIMGNKELKKPDLLFSFVSTHHPPIPSFDNSFFSWYIFWGPYVKGLSGN